jgi:hypothetical protein
MHPTSIAFSFSSLATQCRRGRGQQTATRRHCATGLPKKLPKSMAFPRHNTMRGRVIISGSGSRFPSDRLAARDWTIAPGHSASR